MQSRPIESTNLLARGDARSHGQTSPTSARFAWLDRESGERLEITLRGSHTFFEALEACGFERIALEEETPEPHQHERGDSRVA